MKILVKSDVYNICNRIKQFDSSYYLVYNLTNQSYLIYSSNLSASVELISGRVLSYVCALPYKELDARALQYLHETRVENIVDILDDIDKQNAQIEYANNLKLKQNSLQVAENTLRQLT